MRCKPTGKQYIGFTKHWPKRFTQGHKSNPPKAMKPDVQQYQPFEENFEGEALFTCTSASLAKRMEERYIEEFNTLVPHGYNTEKKHAPWCSKFWACGTCRWVQSQGSHTGCGCVHDVGIQCAFQVMPKYPY